jgi:hypothetical protein
LRNSGHAIERGRSGCPPSRDFPTGELFFSLALKVIAPILGSLPADFATFGLGVLAAGMYSEARHSATSLQPCSIFVRHNLLNWRWASPRVGHSLRFSAPSTPILPWRISTSLSSRRISQNFCDVPWRNS